VAFCDGEISAVANLDPDLLRAPRQAVTTAAAHGAEFLARSGWISREYQPIARLMDAAPVSAARPLQTMTERVIQGRAGGVDPPTPHRAAVVTSGRAVRSRVELSLLSKSGDEAACSRSGLMCR